MIFIVPLANNYNVLLGGEFPRNVQLDLAIFLEVLHLRATLTNKVTVQRTPRALRLRHFVVVIHHNDVDGRPSLSQPFQ